MLEQLHIKNFILIDELHLSFTAGLNVLSGETGAGKSIILDAIELICGERGKGEYVRDSEQSAWIEAVFSYQDHPELDAWFQEQGWELEGEPLVLSREIRQDGRSISRLNGRIVSLSILREISSFLLDLHGQNDRRKLLDARYYLSYVDHFLEHGEALLAQVQQAYDVWQGKEKEKQQLDLDERERLQRLDFLRFQLEEIEKAQLEAGEEKRLEEQRDRIQNVENILSAVRKITHFLFEGEGAAADENLYRAMETAKHMQQDLFFQKLAASLESLYYELQEQKYQLDDFQSQLEVEPGRLDEIEERLYQIRSLEKKYGADIPAILEKYAQMQAQREILENISSRAEQLDQEIQQSYRTYEAAALHLREKREQAKNILEQGVRNELRELNLPNIQFDIALQTRSVPGRNGLDDIEFLFSANPGEPLRPLQKIASGGELSRFTLALKIALAQRYHIETIILDEIDAGLGGVAQRGMAIKLWKFSQNHQLLLITHAAQIAAFAARHFQICKYVQQEKTYSSVQVLDESQRIQELARMLDGDQYSQVSLEHAKQLLQEAQKSYEKEKRGI